MSRRPGCLARQYGDQIICAACGLTWDTNDTEPPDCRKVDRRSKAVKAVAEFDAAPRVAKSPARLPDRLPIELAAEMDKAVSGECKRRPHGRDSGGVSRFSG